MTPLNDIEVLLLADLNVAGEAGRVKTRLLTLVNGSNTTIQDSLDNLLKRDYITVVRAPGDRAIKNKHYISELGREKFSEAVKAL